MVPLKGRRHTTLLGKSLTAGIIVFSYFYKGILRTAVLEMPCPNTV